MRPLVSALLTFLLFKNFDSKLLSHKDISKFEIDPVSLFLLLFSSKYLSSLDTPILYLSVSPSLGCLFCEAAVLFFLSTDESPALHSGYSISICTQ